MEQPTGFFQQKKKNFYAKIDALALRERIFIEILILLVIYFIWYLIFIIPLEKKSQSQHIQKIATEQRIHFLNAKISELTNTNDSTDIEKKRNILNQKIKELDERIDTLNKKMVSSVEVLAHDLSQQTTGLQLENLTLLPAEEITIQNLGDNRVPAYAVKQGVELALNGNYFQFFDYLQSLEEMSYQIFWSRLDYDVVNYPNAKATLKIYLLRKK